MPSQRTREGRQLKQLNIRIDSKLFEILDDASKRAGFLKTDFLEEALADKLQDSMKVGVSPEIRLKFVAFKAHRLVELASRIRGLEIQIERDAADYGRGKKLEFRNQKLKRAYQLVESRIIALRGEAEKLADEIQGELAEEFRVYETHDSKLRISEADAKLFKWFEEKRKGHA